MSRGENTPLAVIHSRALHALEAVEGQSRPLPVVLSGKEVARLIAAAPNAKYQAALSVAHVRCATRAASMPPSRATLDEHAAADSAPSGFLLSAAARLGRSAITTAHLAEASQYRRVLVRPS